MQTVVEIPETHVPLLAALCKQERISQEALIARALAEYLANHRPHVQAGDPAFGAWKHLDTGDSVEYQRSLRAECGRLGFSA